MNPISIVQHHGYAATALVMLLSSLGLPLPMGVALLSAGAVAHGGGLRLSLVLGCAWLAAVFGDTLIYFGGRYTGWWLLSGICRLSVNPESCIFGSAHRFHQRGARTLLVSKFIPGLGTVAPALAGSLNMRVLQFLRLDSAGVLLYASVWTLAGYAFSRYVRQIIAYVAALGHVAVETVAGILLLYGMYVLVNTLRDRRFTTVERVAAEQLLTDVQQATHDRLLVIADVRSHGYYDPGQQRIQNSIRVEPNRLQEELEALREFMAPECEIFLYCSCARDATSIRVAHELGKKNCSTKVIHGGLKAWIRAGGPVEPVPEHDVEHLPSFE